MPKIIEFFFDLSSPYGYMATYRAEEIEQKTGYRLEWNPYLMGAVFKQTDRQPLVSYPLVSEYTLNDIKRSCRKISAPLSIPDKFPVVTAGACRACYWAEEQDTQTAQQLVKALYSAYFVENRDISKSDTVLDVIAEAGLDREHAAIALASQELKDKARQKTSAAMHRGIFGSPFFLVNGETFWGNDRIDDLILWCQRGGW
ncbi:MAG: 2-hydroxychromene-2-carboxylate isomerase [Gammaproteobacteria bacterium]|jgi:2-hydroxychromene-2-carboxylate isomerase